MLQEEAVGSGIPREEGRNTRLAIAPITQDFLNITQTSESVGDSLDVLGGGVVSGEEDMNSDKESNEVDDARANTMIHVFNMSSD